MKALEEMGIVSRNANYQVQPMTGFVPILEVSMSYLEGTGWNKSGKSQKCEAEACESFGRNGLCL